LTKKNLLPPTLGEADRYHVIVFQYPEPQPEVVNYVMRLVGLPGESLAIYQGDLYHSTEPRYPESAADAVDLWQPQHMHRNDEGAVALFRKGGFTILRRPPELMLSLRHLVYDNDLPARDLEGVLPPRWAAAGDKGPWQADGRAFRHAGGGAEGVDWVRYRHVLRPADWPGGKDRPHRPQLVTDFNGFNSYELPHFNQPNGNNWVGDLMLECEVTADGAAGELWLELVRGPDRFRARWELTTGRCTLFRIRDGHKEEELKAAATKLTGPGTYKVRFANFDQRLTVWADGALPFGDGVEYARPWSFDEGKREYVNAGPTAHDLGPAAVGGKGAAMRVSGLKLWRDVYYPLGAPADADLPAPQVPDELRDPVNEEDLRRRDAVVAQHRADFWGDPERWEPLRRLDVQTMFVQPGHYLVLGDNSPASSDSRTWGLVPQRLLVGRAAYIYFPFDLAGRVR
jgi:signal peptidase I